MLIPRISKTLLPVLVLQLRLNAPHALIQQIHKMLLLVFVRPLPVRLQVPVRLVSRRRALLQDVGALILPAIQVPILALVLRPGMLFQIATDVLLRHVIPLITLAMTDTRHRVLLRNVCAFRQPAIRMLIFVTQLGRVGTTILEVRGVDVLK